MVGSSSDSASGWRGAQSPAHQCWRAKSDKRREPSGPNTGILAHHARILLRMAFLLLMPSTASSTKAQGSSSFSSPGLG